MRSRVGSIWRLDVSTKKELQEDHPHFFSHADDYLQWTPAFCVYGLYALHVQPQHSLPQILVRHALSMTIVSALLYPAKNYTHELRPDGSAYNSFPSGHTANAFLGAELLHQELKNRHLILSYSGYAVASATAALRMYNNRHWLSDVIAGAGVGMLSTKLAYWIADARHRKKEHHYFAGCATYLRIGLAFIGWTAKKGILRVPRYLQYLTLLVCCGANQKYKSATQEKPNREIMPGSQKQPRS